MFELRIGGPKGHGKVATGNLGEMCLGDGDNTGIDAGQNVVLTLQSRGIANPKLPWGIRAWNTCFADSTHGQNQKDGQNCPDGAEEPRGHSGTGQKARAPLPSLGSGFLRQNGLDAAHLV